MNKRLRKILFLILAFAMLVSLFAGCGSNSGTTDSSASASTADVTSEGSSESPESDNQTVKPLKLFVDVTWWPYKEWKGRIPELVSKATGVKPIVTVAADENALDLLIASGDMGDIILSENFNRLSNENTCYDIDTVAQQYNIDVSGIHSVMKFVNTAEDGKTYTQFCGFSPESVMKQYNALVEGRGMVVRTDILDELGVKESDIKGISDFENVLAKVKENYPEVVPFAYNATHDNAFMKMLCGATMDKTGFIDVDNKLYAFIADPNLKEYYMLMNKWYRLGYMTNENFAWVTDTQDLEYMTSGKLFSVSYYDNIAAQWNENQLKKANVDFTVTQLTSIFNQPGAQAVQRVPGWRGLFVAKSSSDPELAMKFCMYNWSEEGQNMMLWGEEGKDWNWSEDKTYPKLNYDFAIPNEEDGMKFWGWMNHNGYQNTAPEKSKETSTLACMQEITKIARFNPVLGMIRINADSDQNTIMNNLIELEKNSKVKIISAKTEADAEAQYNEMIETANQIGMQKLVDWATPIYEKNMASYNAIKDNTK